jgi:hypothetical protein
MFNEEHDREPKQQPQQAILLLALCLEEATQLSFVAESGNSQGVGSRMGPLRVGKLSVI